MRDGREPKTRYNNNMINTCACAWCCFALTLLARLFTLLILLPFARIPNITNRRVELGPPRGWPSSTRRGPCAPGRRAGPADGGGGGPWRCGARTIERDVSGYLHVTTKMVVGRRMLRAGGAMMNKANLTLIHLMRSLHWAERTERTVSRCRNCLRCSGYLQLVQRVREGEIQRKRLLHPRATRKPF